MNRALHGLPFKMLTQRHMIKCTQPQDWFAAIDPHVLILPRHRPFLRFAFEGRAWQYRVLPFGLSLSPHVFTKVVEGVLARLREVGVRILNYLNDWLILAWSQLCDHREQFSQQNSWEQGIETVNRTVVRSHGRAVMPLGLLHMRRPVQFSGRRTLVKFLLHPGSQTGWRRLTPGPVLVLACPGFRSAPLLG